MDPAPSVRPWRSRALRHAAELLTVFAGVTAAFLLDECRGRAAEREALDQARSGIVTELGRYEVRALEYADSIRESVERWRRADVTGQRAVPDLYRIPGATHPPTAAWDAAVSSGVASMFDPELRLELGYFYTEFVGIHDDYARYRAFSEREILPRVELGANAFYDADGRLHPEIRTHMALLAAFSEDLRRISVLAGELKERLIADAR
ncbi:MAG TPA: hypothetical protein VM737_00905 [Gemmatimonadota bacterium]|nr:hypothetical protein [Gemmatimonadota bacterium]